MRKMYVVLLAISIVTFSHIDFGLAQVTCDSSTDASNFRPTSYGSYYNWGRAQNGWGYCYEWTYEGYVLNGGQPVGDYLCESTRPSYYGWGAAQNGWGYCYHYTPDGLAMNNGQAMANYLCESYSPSHYSWGRGQNGNYYCYQYTPNGLVMNSGQPVDNYFCR